MIKPIHPIAMFRIMVLGPLISREKLNRGELKKIIEELASRSYNIPGSKRSYLSAQAIERWYYAWLRGGIDALVPKTRADKNKTTAFSEKIQALLISYKKDNLSRSINTLIRLLEVQGFVATGELSRATVHRFLKTQQLSKRTVADANTIERRAFQAERACDIWYGDVLHGPKIPTAQGMRKTYLVSMMDDASRLITHSAFCLSETALDIEFVLKQAVLKRGLPKKLIIDNGAAYRSNSLQGICARLGIHIIYSRPYEPESKGKLERYHRTFREQFLNELNLTTIHNLEDLNTRLWSWVESYYHQKEHAGLPKGLTPLTRWRQDLIHVRSLGTMAANIDEIFYHRITRFVRKDATISWDGKYYEVPFEHANTTVWLVVNPQLQSAHRIETEDGQELGAVTELNAIDNLHRKRQRPTIEPAKNINKTSNINAVELTHQKHLQRYQLTDEEI